MWSVVRLIHFHIIGIKMWAVVRLIHCPYATFVTPTAYRFWFVVRTRLGHARIILAYTETVGD